MAETRPSPYALFKEHGDSDAYRIAMLEHGYVIPNAPWRRKLSGKRALQCGLTHEENWTDWRNFNDGGREFEARWCQTCGSTQSREVRRDG